jgi:hypothetical protein
MTIELATDDLAQKPTPSVRDALAALLDWGCTYTSPTDANSPHELLIAAAAALDAQAANVQTLTEQLDEAAPWVARAFDELLFSEGIPLSSPAVGDSPQPLMRDRAAWRNGP